MASFDTVAGHLSVSNERNRAKTVARLAIAISLGTLAWACVIGFAIFGYWQQITWQLWKNRLDEILFFAYAFSVAGAITSTVAYVAAGKRRWAIGACAFNIVLLAASLPVVRWFVYHKIGPNDGWMAKLVWDYARDSAAFAVVLGCTSALIVSGLILASLVLERHLKRWQFGLIVAMTVAFLGLGVLPWLAYSLPELAALSALRPHYAQLHSASLFASGMTGAGSGSLAGAVVAGLFARCIDSEAPGSHS